MFAEAGALSAGKASPDLLRKLKDRYEPVKRKLHPEAARDPHMEHMALNEEKFRWLLNEDAMATEKLAEGIRSLADDARKLERLVTERLAIA